MSSESIVLAFSLLDSMALLFLAVYYIIVLSDAECDYINSTSCCEKLNMIVVPEIICSVILLLAFASSLMLLPVFVNLPMTAWVIYRYMTKPKSRLGIFDPAELHNRHGIKTFLKEAMVKLGYQLICFFFYLYWLITHLVSDDTDIPTPI